MLAVGLTLDATELRAVAVIVASNIMLNRALPRGAEVPAGLAAAGAVALIAIGSDATRDDVGFAADPLPAGARLGVKLGAPIGTALMLAASSSRLARLYAEEEMAATGPLEALYQFGIRIPIATAAAEEIIFRGGLEALLRRRRSPGRAALVASLLFGAWHVLPTLDRMEAGRPLAAMHDGSVLRKVVSVGVVVAGTFAAGLGFSLLRRKTGSIMAPIIVHASLNGGGYIGSWLRSRTRKQAPELRPPVHGGAGAAFDVG